MAKLGIFVVYNNEPTRSNFISSLGTNQTIVPKRGKSEPTLYVCGRRMVKPFRLHPKLSVLNST